MTGSKAVDFFPVFIDDVGKLIHIAISIVTSVSAHQRFLFGQRAVALDRMINVHQIRVGRSEHGSRTGIDELLKQIHVLVTPASNRRVEAACGRQVGLVHAHYAKAVLSPIASVLVDQKVVGRSGEAVDDHRVELAVDDGKVRGPAAHGVQPHAFHQRGRPQHVHVDEEQKVAGRSAFGAQVQRQRPGKRFALVRQHGYLGTRVLGSEPRRGGHRVLGRDPSEWHHHEPGVLEVVGLQAHRLVVVHEPVERGQPIGEW